MVDEVEFGLILWLLYINLCIFLHIICTTLNDSIHLSVFGLVDVRNGFFYSRFLGKRRLSEAEYGSDFVRIVRLFSKAPL
jgi:hypothetical protein